MQYFSRVLHPENPKYFSNTNPVWKTVPPSLIMKNDNEYISIQAVTSERSQITEHLKSAIDSSSFRERFCSAAIVHLGQQRMSADKNKDNDECL